MVLNEDLISVIEQNTLDALDVINDMGFSDSGVTELPSADTLAGEFNRKVLTVKNKDTDLITYEFDAILGLTESNGETLRKFGLFTAISGNNLQFSKVLDDSIPKTADIEINVGFEFSINVVDET